MKNKIQQIRERGKKTDKIISQVRPLLNKLKKLHIEVKDIYILVRLKDDSLRGFNINSKSRRRN